MQVHCPECRGTFRVEGRESGTTFECPFCQTGFSFQDRNTVVLRADPARVVTSEGPPSTKTPGSAVPPDDAEPAPEDARASDLENRPTVGVRPRSDEPTVLKPRPTPPPGAPIPPELTDLKVGDIVNDSYRLEEVIGWGGMSVVFRARQLSLNRNVALKILRKDLGEDPEFSKRFLEEAKALAELGHPNIVAVFDQGVYRGNHFLVMEFVDGVSLREVLNERKLSPKEALALIPALCTALEYAHDKGIIHRDIKPENILLDRAGVPKIADFGLARIVSTGEDEEHSRITKTQTVLGTLDYMAPEQREGTRDIDHRADIYSLGVVLYELLTGELPIAHFPLPSQKVQVDVRLDEVVLKVLAKDREQRYQRASMVATDIQRIRDGDATSLTAESTPRTIGGRLIQMGSSFPFFFFTLMYVVILASTRSDDPKLFFTGLAIPFYLSQCILHGIIPRPVFQHRSTFLFRHPILSFGLIAFFLAIMLGEGDLDDDPAHLFLGLTIGTGVSLALWKKKLFRRQGEPEFGPWIGEPDGFTHRDRKATHRADVMAAQATARAAQVARRAVGSMFGTTPPAPPHPEDGDDSSGGVEAERGVARDETEESVEPEPGKPPRKRVSLFVGLGFLATLLTLFFSLSAGILFLAFDWSAFVTQVAMADIDYPDVQSGLDEMWQWRPESVLNSVTAACWLLFLLPLALPVTLQLLALPGLIHRKRRGFPLFVVNGVLIGVAGLILIATSTSLYDSGRHYAAKVDGPYRNPIWLERADNDPVTAALLEAESTSSRVERFALFHHVSNIAGGEGASYKSRSPLIRIVLDNTASNVERMTALYLLESLYSEALFQDPEDGNPPPNWIDRFISSAYDRRRGTLNPRTDPEVAYALLQVLSDCGDDRLREPYWWALNRMHSYPSQAAVDWFTRCASVDSVLWLVEQCRAVRPQFLSHGPSRERLFRPLLAHPDPQVSRRATELLDGDL